MSNILFATGEVYPLIKTGGLADVAASLPRALTKLGQNVRILLPAYASVMRSAADVELKKMSTVTVEGRNITLWKTRLPGTRVMVLLADIPEFSERDGNPYCGADGLDWPDNSLRFYLFAQAARLIALNLADLKWAVDIVHCNDWQTGLIPALLSRDTARPATVFTIHNLAYRGLFPYQDFVDLKLPAEFWHHDSLEFYGQLAFMKGGLVYADRITTVSPGYASEIQTVEMGNGLDGLLRHRQQVLSGILNGIDSDEWNPGTDKYIAQTYNRRTLRKKLVNKTDLQKQLGLHAAEDVPMLGFIGRFVEQKGLDLIIDVLPKLLAEGCQIAILGSGMPHYEESLKLLAARYPTQLSVTIGYDESLAHKIEAGVDIFMMPSAFEPCGLNQLYSLRYGTVPVVHAVGGLKDSINDIALIKEDTDANGVLFHNFSATAFYAALQHAIECFQNKRVWKKLQDNGMASDLSWQNSAQEYLTLYKKL